MPLKCCTSCISRTNSVISVAPVAAAAPSLFTVLLLLFHDFQPLPVPAALPSPPLARCCCVGVRWTDFSRLGGHPRSGYHLQKLRHPRPGHVAVDTSKRRACNRFELLYAGLGTCWQRHCSCICGLYPCSLCCNRDCCRAVRLAAVARTGPPSPKTQQLNPQVPVARPYSILPVSGVRWSIWFSIWPIWPSGARSQ